MEKTKINNPNKWVTRDFVTLGIFYVLYFVIYTLSAPLSMSVVGNLFIHGTCGILWGITFPLLCTKVNKPGVVFTYTFLIGAIQLMNFWGTGLFIMLGAVIAEVIWNILNKKKFITIAICHVIVVAVMYLGMTLPLMILSSTFLNYIPEYSRALFEEVYNLLNTKTYFFYIGLTAAVVGASLGALLGKILLKKHFVKAGII